MNLDCLMELAILLILVKSIITTKGCTISESTN